MSGISDTTAADGELTLAEAIHKLRNGFNKADQRIEEVLGGRLAENALAEIWSKLNAQPEKYVLRKDELDLLYYHQERFKDNDTYWSAVTRFWHGNKGARRQPEESGSLDVPTEKEKRSKFDSTKGRTQMKINSQDVRKDEDNKVVAGLAEASPRITPSQATVEDYDSPDSDLFVPKSRLPRKSSFEGQASVSTKTSRDADIEPRRRRPTSVAKNDDAKANSTRRPKTRLRPVIIDNRQGDMHVVSCDNPNCRGCDQNARPTTRRGSFTETLDQRSTRSDPTPYYPPHSSYEYRYHRRATDGYTRGPAIIQPAQSRRRPSVASRPRPLSYSDQPVNPQAPGYAAYHNPYPVLPSSPFTYDPPVSQFPYSDHYPSPPPPYYSPFLPHDQSAAHSEIENSQAIQDVQLPLGIHGRRPSISKPADMRRNPRSPQYSLNRRPSVSRPSSMSTQPQSSTSGSAKITPSTSAAARRQPAQYNNYGTVIEPASRRRFTPYGSDSSYGEDSDTEPKGISTSNKTGNSEIRFRVDASAPLALTIDGDMEGRTLQLLPAENGMTDVVIAPASDKSRAKGKHSPNVSSAKAKKLRDIREHHENQRNILRQTTYITTDPVKSPNEKTSGVMGREDERPVKSDGGKEATFETSVVVAKTLDVDLEKQKEQKNDPTGIARPMSPSKSCDIPGCGAIFRGEDSNMELVRHAADEHVRPFIPRLEKEGYLTRNPNLVKKEHVSQKDAPFDASGVRETDLDLTSRYDASSAEKAILEDQQRTEPGKKTKKAKKTRLPSNPQRPEAVVIRDPSGKVLRVVPARKDKNNTSSDDHEENSAGSTVLKTPVSATYPLGPMTPVVPTSTTRNVADVIRDDELKVPITPPQAYLDFLETMTPDAQKLYVCEAPDCDQKLYSTEDVRLEHYEPNHPELLPASTVNGMSDNLYNHLHDGNTLPPSQVYDEKSTAQNTTEVFSGDDGSPRSAVAVSDQPIREGFQLSSSQAEHKHQDLENWLRLIAPQQHASGVEQEPSMMVRPDHSGGIQLRGPWSRHEDQWLVELVARNGDHNWVRISQELGFRSPMQCSKRWHQYLEPSLNHDPITPEEGELIEKLVTEIGKRWAEIANHLTRRSGTAVKHWWNGRQHARAQDTNPSAIVAEQSAPLSGGLNSHQLKELLGYELESASPEDRWEELRQKAAERTARMLEVKKEAYDREITRYLDEGETSGEEAIESRVARIKARVVELTNNEDVQLSTLQHDQMVAEHTPGFTNELEVLPLDDDGLASKYSLPQERPYKKDLHTSRSESELKEADCADSIQPTSSSGTVPAFGKSPILASTARSTSSSCSASVISVFSVESLATSASDLSKASGYSATQIATATKVLISIFEEDEVLLPLYKSAIESPVIGPDRLQRNLRRLLKAYAELLGNEANDQLEYLASKLVSLKSRWLAQTIVEKFRAIEQDQRASTPVIHLSKDDESSDEEKETHPVSEEVFGDLIIFREFLTGSEAFDTFRTQVRSFVFPQTFEIAGTNESITKEELMGQSLPIEKPLDVKGKDRSRSWATWHEHVGKFRSNYRPLTAVPLYLLSDMLVLALETLLVSAGGLEPRLSPGKTRLRWKCVRVDQSAFRCGPLLTS